MGTTTIRVLAAAMVVAHAVAWMLWSRWERPGRHARLAARIDPPPLLGQTSDLVQITPLVYPLLVVVFPDLGYDSRVNWSSAVDRPLQAVGLGLWALGMAGVTWAAGTLGRYVAVDGLTDDHELITHGPYAYVRHPVYASFAAIAAGVALVFRSYLLVAVAVAMAIAGWWWARLEEALLASPEGFGDEYRRYCQDTGRFLPRLRKPREPPGRS